MSKPHVSQLRGTPLQAQGGNQIDSYIEATFGGSGAVSTYANSDAHWVVAKTAGQTGIYTITGPTASRMAVLGKPSLESTYADRDCKVTSVVASTGVITVTTGAAGSAADATSGDILKLWVRSRRFNQ